MRKFITIVSIGILFLLSANTAGYSQTTTMNSGKVGQGIQFNGFGNAPGVMLVNFEIPYGGIVVFSLYDQTGKKVWHKQGALERGENQYVIRRSGFNPGKDYTFTLKYKLSEVTGNVPPQP